MARYLIDKAACNGDLTEIQRLLIDDPSLIESQGIMDYTPLIAAASYGHKATVEWLINHGGANVNAQDRFEATALYHSSFIGHLDIVSFLLYQGGVDVNKANDNGMRPLMIAALERHVDVVELLLSQPGIDLDARARDGETALWFASDEGYVEILQRLVEAGADPTVADNDGQTPLDKARQGGYDGCIKLLEVSVRDVFYLTFQSFMLTPPHTYTYTFTQAALSAPECARLLHRARAISDAQHAINKVIREAEDMEDEEEKKRKLVTAAPAYLKERVREGRELPQVVINAEHEDNDNEEDEDQQRKQRLTAAVEQMVLDGHVSGEVFIELMEMMLPQWDEERRR